MAAQIPLSILLPLVAGGVAAIALLTHLTGWSERAELDEDSARARFDQDFPGSVDGAETLVADDRMAALLALPGGSVGVVRVLGDKLVTRRIARGGYLRRVEARGESLRLSFDDPGWPRVDVEVADAVQRSRWGERLGALVV